MSLNTEGVFVAEIAETELDIFGIVESVPASLRGFFPATFRANGSAAAGRGRRNTFQL